MNDKYSLEYAQELDENDPLKTFRDRFNIPLAKNSTNNSEINDDRKGY